jgi:hypothetical protein
MVNSAVAVVARLPTSIARFVIVPSNGAVTVVKLAWWRDTLALAIADSTV